MTTAITSHEIRLYVWLDENGCIVFDKTFERQFSYGDIELLTACIKRSIRESDDGNTIDPDMVIKYFMAYTTKGEE